jgi:hypothetical protein
VERVREVVNRDYEADRRRDPYVTRGAHSPTTTRAINV